MMGKIPLVTRARQTLDKAANSGLIISILSDLTRGRADLVIENAL